MTAIRSLAFVTGKNVRLYVEACLASLVRQECQEFDVLYVDDCSDDGSVFLVAEWLQRELPGRHRLVRNVMPLGKAGNADTHLRRAIEELRPEFVFVVDADDALVSASSVSLLDAGYRAGADVVWGNYITSDGREGHCGPLRADAHHRAQGWRTSHLFSFRARLWLNVPGEYLRGADGAYLRSACDIAIALPILDQTPNYLHLPMAMYCYNTGNPVSHHNAQGALQGTYSSSAQSGNARYLFALPPLVCHRRELGQARLTERFAEIVEGQRRDSDPAEMLGGWAMERPFLEHLFAEFARRPQPVVIEFGSGAATPVLAARLKELGGRLISVEHDPFFARATRAQLKYDGVEDAACVVEASLVDLEYEGITTRFYDPAFLAALDWRFDFVIVDGPPQVTSPLARLAALPVIAPYLAPGFSLYLDDAEREAEQRIIGVWQTVEPALQRSDMTFAKKTVCRMTLAQSQ